MAISMTGIGSGLDLGALVDQLVAAEELPAKAVAAKKNGANRQLSLVGELASKLKGLEDAVKAVDEAQELKAYQARSSEEARLKVSANGSASPGTYAVAIDRLATRALHHSGTYASDAAGVLGTGSLEITVGTGTPVTVTYDATDSLTTFAKKLNDASAKVDASVLFDGTTYRLLVSARDLGTAAAPTFAEAGTGLGLAELTAAADAQVRLNGITVVRPSNQLTDVLPGVTFDLVSTTPEGGAATEVTVSKDPAALKGKLQTVVDAYNSVVKMLNAQLAAGKGADPAATLQGDPGLRFLQRGLAEIASSGYTSNGTTTSLRVFGIKLGNDGTMSIDGITFDAALAKDPDGLTTLITGANGFAARVKALATEQLTSGTGTLMVKQTNLRKRIEGYDDQIDQIQARATQAGTRLRNQFAALDRLMSDLKSQSSYLASLYGG